MLPSRATDGSTGCAHAPHSRGTVIARDRPRIPAHRTDGAAAAGPGEAQDPRRRHSVPRPATGPLARAAQRRTRRPLPGVQRGVRLDRGRVSSRRALRRGDLADTRREPTYARRTRDYGIARADAATAFPTAHPCG